MSGAATKTRGRQSGTAAGGAGGAVKRAATPQAGAVPAYARGGGLKVGAPHSPQEQEAEAVGRAVRAGAPAPAIAGLAPAVQRAAKPEQEVRKATKQDQEEQAKPVARAAQPGVEKLPQPVQKAALPEEKQQPVQRAGKPEEKPVQKASAEPVKQEMPVQKAATTEAEPIRRAPEEEPETDAPEPSVERAEVAAAAVPAPQAEAAEAMAAARAGEARPLPQELRATLESSLGADLSEVRLHSGPQAIRAAELLQARAMTQGTDIFLGKGESETDLELMGHEAAHVLQQGSGAEPEVQRVPNPAPRPPVDRARAAEAAREGTVQGSDTFDHERLGKLTLGSSVGARALEIPSVTMPGYKAAFHGNNLPLSTEKRSAFEARLRADPQGQTQVQIWVGGLSGARQTLVDEIKAKGSAQHIRKDPTRPNESEDSNPRVYFFTPRSARRHHVIGTAEDIADRAMRPTWDENGHFALMQVDHKRELQLQGPHESGNLWLLDSESNQESGRAINDQIQTSIETLSAAARIALQRRRMPLYDTLRYKSNAMVRQVVPQGGGGGNPRFYEKTDIETKKSVNCLVPMPPADIQQLNGSASSLALFSSGLGGRRWTLPFDAATGRVTNLSGITLPGFQPSQLTFTQGQGGQLDGSVVLPEGAGLSPIRETFPLAVVPGLTNAAVFSQRGMQRRVNTELRDLCPFNLETLELRESGVYARGQVLPELDLLRGVQLHAEIDGAAIRMEATLAPGQISLPGPVQITDSSLTLIAGTDGVRAEGGLDLEIARVGSGRIEAGLGQRGVALRGSFDFDTTLFSQASIEAWYENETFGAAGTLSIGEGRIRGIRAATIRAQYEQGVLSATGEVTPAIPAVREGRLSVTYGEEQGLSIAGALTLGTIPGFSGGSLNAQLEQEGETWKVKADGTMTPAIPGATGEISASYDDGAFLVRGTAGYERGMLSGSLTIGATNQAVGDDGAPSGPPTDAITVFGSGSATLRLAPWLQATATVELLPNGEIAVTGEIGLPSAIDLFEAKRLDKELFSIGLDIPILGFAVAGQRVGIFANISGGAQIGAGIGPGQLTDMRLSVHYNPSHEDQTQVHGQARLVVPADAGLRLSVSASIGAGLAIVSAQGGLEAGGMAGLTGALEAGVDVDWRPGQGLAIDAAAEIWAEPRLRFDLTGFARVDADLVLTTIELYHERWELAAVEIGSDMRLGVKFPVRWREGEPFNLSLSDVEFTVPEIDPAGTIGNLVGRVV